jgi:hypothetical protein
MEQALQVLQLHCVGFQQCRWTLRQDFTKGRADEDDRMLCGDGQ